MNVPIKLGAYGAGLAAVFAVALGAGAAAGPFGEPADPHGTEHPATTTADHGDHEESDMQTMDHAADTPAGLAVSSNGFTLVPTRTTYAPDEATTFAFRIDGPEGRPVTDFEPEHDKELHLIVVSRDLARYQHVHPVRGADGTWTVEIDLTAPGTYRALADFMPEGADGLTLGVDLQVAGTIAPAPAFDDRRGAEVDGYEVTLDGELRAGAESRVTLSVAKDGRAVTDLEPYLAAYGHLVALRSGDLAYLHVHPEGAPDDGETPAGPDVDFVAHVPSAGTYRLFLDFKHEGVMRTAAFTVEVPHQTDPATAEADHGEEGHGS